MKWHWGVIPLLFLTIVFDGLAPRNEASFRGQTATSGQSVSGTPVPSLVPPPAETPISISSDGHMAFVSDRDGNWDIYVMAADGSNPRNLTHNSANDQEPVWSPDGSQIAFMSNRDGDMDIYVMNSDGSHLRRLTNNDMGDQFPDWSPDGNQIAFSTYRDGNWDIYGMETDGSNPRNLTRNPADDHEPDWSPDGSQIAFTSNREGGDMDIYAMEANGDHPRNLTNNSFQDFYSPEDMSPAWSPDGRQIAFASCRYVTWAIFVMNSDGSDQRPLSRIGQEGQPSWSLDGNQIAFAASPYSDPMITEIYIINTDGSAPYTLADGMSPVWQPVIND